MSNSYYQQPEDTFQQQQQQQQSGQVAGSIPPLTQQQETSPRRRKAPIDIDTALRLQSQASYVQEPARASPSASGASSGITNVSSATPASSHAPTTSTTTTATPPHASRSHFISQQHKQVACHTASYYDHHYQPQQQQQVGNISVDYIDCLSNNDLPGRHNPQQQQQQTSQSSGLAMRKHLGRFHRSHRIEPEALGQQQHLATATATAAGPASSADDESPPGNSQTPRCLGRLSAGGGDSSSQVTCSNSTDCSSSFDHTGGPTSSVAVPAPSGPSVLYPILVSEAKKRTYFIGSVSQDSLLGHEELLRYFPTGRVSIFVCTWNQNRKRAPLNLNDLLLPDRLEYMADIYSIGIQEAYSSQTEYLREWEIELQTTLGPSHVLLHSCSLGSLHLSLFIRRDLIWFCSQAEESQYNSRSMPTNMIKTKGAVSIAFRFFGTSFMFTNCHFPAHENKLRDRIDEYQRIISSIDLPKNLKLLKPRYLSNDSTARFDCVFFMGDLNFRLEQRTFDETIQILDDIFQSRELSYEALTQNDELLRAMETQQAFHGFDESQIKFPPTYKFLAQTNKYDRQTKRVPSYTDRILFRSKRRRHIQCLVYDWLPQLMSSDHKPVYSLFDVLIRPGHEQNMVSSLNAGLFQRTVYIEALKRRAEDPDGIRENGAGGNLICSIT